MSQLYLDKYHDAIQGQDTSVRDASSKGRDVRGPHHTGNALSEGRNVRVFSIGDTSVGDTFLERKIFFVYENE